MGNSKGNFRDLGGGKGGKTQQGKEHVSKGQQNDSRGG